MPGFFLLLLQTKMKLMLDLTTAGCLGIISKRVVRIIMLQICLVFQDSNIHHCCHGDHRPSVGVLCLPKHVVI